MGSNIHNPLDLMPNLTVVGSNVYNPLDLMPNLTVNRTRRFHGFYLASPGTARRLPFSLGVTYRRSVQ